MFKFLQNTLVGGFIMATLAVSLESSTTYFSNISSSETSIVHSPVASVCCFVIQETVSEIWAEIYWTSTWHQVVNKTLITAHVTPYPNKTITNFETNVHTTNGTFSTPEPWGRNPLQNFAFNAPGPAETTSVYDTSQTVVAGQTIQSPQAAYVYTTVKIITAEPVTDLKGNIACATPWSYPEKLLYWYWNITKLEDYGAPTQGQSVEVFPSINSNAQAYWGSDVAGQSWRWTDQTVFTTTTSSITQGISVSAVTQSSVLFTNKVHNVFWVNSKMQSIDTNTVTQVGITITLDQPFVYQPKTAALGTSGVGETGCRIGEGTEGYGFPPPTLISYIAQKPALSRQYPGIENCIPAGASMLRPTYCTVAAPGFQEVASDLTEMTTITITPQLLPITTGPLTSTNDAAPASISSLVLPDISTPSKEPLSATSSSQSESLLASPSPSSVISPTEASPTVPPQSTDMVPASTVEVGSPPTSEIGWPTDSSAPEIASIIASIIGANPLQAPTVIEGTTEIVVSGETTIPLNPTASISGNTVVSNGVTQVVVSLATTLLLSQVVVSLPGSMILVSGTLEAALGPSTIPMNSNLPGLSGSTTSISGTRYVVIESPTTVPLVLGRPTSSSGAGSNGTIPIQVSYGAKRMKDVRIEGLVILMGLVTLALI